MDDRGPNTGNAYVSTAQAAEALGIGITTVKRWVDRGILPAHKTAGGHRKLLLRDVVRVVRDMGLPSAGLSHLGSAPAAGRPPDTASLSTALFTSLRRGDADGVSTLLMRAHRSGLPTETLADAIIAPAMRQIGHEWAAGRLEVWQEHRGTLLCAAALYEIRASLKAPDSVKRPLAVGGGPEGDPYLLANLLAEMALTNLGWRAINLGPNTPIASFRDALSQLRPRLIWLSVGHLAEKASFLKQYRGLYQEAVRTGTAVAIGGRALTEPMRAGMPYTTYGDGLSHLCAFARSLSPAAPRPRRGRPPRDR